MKVLLFPAVIILFLQLFSGISASERAAFKPNELLVKYRSNVGEFSIESFKSLYNLSLLDKSLKLRVYRYLASNSANLELLRRQIESEPEVEYAEYNYIYYADEYKEGSTIEPPNDPSFKELWGLKNTGQNGGSIGADINAEGAWEFTKGSRDVLVAVIDTGVDYIHEDLTDNIWINPDETGIDADGKDKATNGKDDGDIPNGYIDDVRGWDFANKDNDPKDDHYHGTHVAGTIGAVGNNNKGVVGVNWNVSILPIKFLSSAGSGNTMDAINSIEYATKMKVDIMSNSWGGGGYSKAMEDAIRAALEAGILFVAAAGNSSSDNDDTPHYPSNYQLDNVVSVAATDRYDNLSSFSCFGNSTVHVAAPGSEILSTTTGSQYKKLSGTSMATPHVSGVSVLIKSLYPDLNYSQLKGRLLGGAKRINSLDEKIITGARLNALNSIENDQMPPAPISNLATLASGVDWISLTFSYSGDDGAIGSASFYEIRYSKDVIDDTNFDKAEKGGYFTHKEGAENFEFTVRDLQFSTPYYFAVKAFDNVGNGSPITSISSKTLDVKLLAVDDFESDSGLWNYEKPWAVISEEGAGHFLTDSPDGAYEKGANVSVTSNEFNFGQKSVYLSFRHKYDLENVYDFGYLEIETPESNSWTLVKKQTGKNANWTKESVNISPFLGQSGVFKIRFRLQSDDIISKDGWYIDDVVLYSENNPML